MIGRVIVALNVGNTNVAWAIVGGGELTATGHAPTPGADAAYEAEMIFDQVMGRAPAGDTHLEIVLASVVPTVTGAIREVAARRGWRLLIADEATVPIETRLAAPGAAGHDRLVNAYAALRLYGAPAIVIDLGTATTFDVVGADGAFLGGAIAPGAGLGLDALATRTAQLPRVALVLPPRAIGGDTITAIQSGTVLGHVGMVEYLLRAISAELESEPRVILTGGLATHPWAAAIRGVTAVEPLLTLRGLALLHSEVARRQSVPSA